MKTRIGLLRYISLLLIVAFTLSCNSKSQSEDKEYNEKAKELIDLVESHPEIKSMLEKSINKAKLINPDKNSNPVQSLDEYYDFVSWAEETVPWVLLQTNKYPTIYDNLLQSLVYFYFLNDQPLKELEGKGYFNNSLQYYEPYSKWMTSLIIAWGKYLDTEDSWNEDYYRLALEDDKFGLKNGWYEDPSNWTTFNQFFARYLKSPEERPITAINDNSVIVSPADAVPQGVWKIDSNSNIELEEVIVKAGKLKSIKHLIGEDSKYSESFANGTFTHTFLNVNDYHRYHFPLGGIVKEVRIISANNAIGAIITWDPKSNKYLIDPSKIGWQTVETRGCIILETKEYGLIALMPIGMAQVGSVNFEASIKAGIEVKKGDMMGYFLFGGSDFIMIFQDKANFVLDAPIDADIDDSYQHLLMGEKYGHFVEKRY